MMWEFVVDALESTSSIGVIRSYSNSMDWGEGETYAFKKTIFLNQYIP